MKWEKAPACDKYSYTYILSFRNIIDADLQSIYIIAYNQNSSSHTSALVSQTGTAQVMKAQGENSGYFLGFKVDIFLEMSPQKQNA